MEESKFMQNFRTYNLARELYLACKSLKLKGAAKDQLDRASLSIVLNLAEGSGKFSKAEKKRFYGIALGSLREVQALVSLFSRTDLEEKASQVGAYLYRLILKT